MMMVMMVVREERGEKGFCVSGLGHVWNDVLSCVGSGWTGDS